jgi:hypothetical protein
MKSSWFSFQRTRRKQLTGTKSTDWAILDGVRKIHESSSAPRPIKILFISRSHWRSNSFGSSCWLGRTKIKGQTTSRIFKQTVVDPWCLVCVVIEIWAYDSLPERFRDAWFTVMCRVSSRHLSKKQFVSRAPAGWQLCAAAKKVM